MIGIDAVAIPRIESFIEKHGERGLSRFLSKKEQELIKSPKTAAGFWAVKEAVSKALGCGIGSELSFLDITISKTPKGAPVVTLSKEVQKRHSTKDIAVSITHDGDLAIAVCFISR